MLKALHAAPFALVCLLAAQASGCQLELAPKVPKTAIDAGYQIALQRLRGTGVPPSDYTTGVEVDLHVEAWRAGSAITGASVTELDASPCEGGTKAKYWRVQGDGAVRWDEPLEAAPGHTLQLGFPRSSWALLAGGPSRVDVVLTQPDGSEKCTMFAVGGEPREQRWITRAPWTLAPFMGVEGFSAQVNGLSSFVYFGAELGKWHGPLHYVVSVGGGSSQCLEQACELPTNKQVSNRYYVPVAAGIEATLIELWLLSLDVRGEYRVGFTSADLHEGRQDFVLHGPVLSPSLFLSLSGLPLPFGIRAMRSAPRFAVRAPVGYVMSNAGDAAFSVGGSVAFEFPLR